MSIETEFDHARHWYQLVSSPEELGRVVNPTTAEDDLLRIKADAILDNTRCFRVKLHRAQKTNARTLLFSEHQGEFKKYLSRFPKFEQQLCSDIPCDYILSPSPDAMCLKTDNGRVIIVSEVLRYFLYFMNLASLDFPDVSEQTRLDARLIGLRTMLLSESLDFDMDPRGIVPSHIHEQLVGMVDWQLQFVIGHEYAHQCLGHLDQNRPYRAFKSKRDDGRSEIDWSVYSREQSQEFEADIHAVGIPVADKGERYSLVIGATMFLMNLYFYEKVAEEIDPGLKEINTHPPTLDRFWNLVGVYGKDCLIDKESANIVINRYDEWADAIISHYKQYPDVYTKYGSLYLNEWRGRVLIDRVDY